MMRFPTGVTDQYIYFVAVDSGDYVTRETGLSSFTVYRIRNAASTPTAYTTPTVTEVSSSNMPGVYSLLLDEDMTITSGDHSNAVCLHITHAGMAPVTLQYELYRPDVTAGETIGVSSGAVSNVTTTATATAVTTVNGLAAGVITAAAIATDAIDADALAADAGTEIGTAVWATAARTLTALDEDSTTIDIDNSVWGGGTRTLTALDEDTTTLDLDATIRTAVGLASANLDTQISDINTNINDNEVKIDAVGTIVIDIESDLTALTTDIGSNGAGLTAIPWNSSWDAEVQSEVDDALVAYDTAKETDIPTEAEVADAVWDEILAGHAIPGSAGEALDGAGGGAAAPTVEEIADELETRILDVNIVQVNSIGVDGTGTENDPWGPE